MVDLLLKKGTIVDGTGAPAFPGDVAVKAGRIVSLGRLEGLQALQEIDITGKVLCPGFIDIHAHADLALLTDPKHQPKVRQGVTTEIFSNCGLGFAPATPQGLRLQREYLLGLFGEDRGIFWNWQSVQEYLSLLDGRTSVNCAYLIPHGAIRVSVMGMERRPATEEEKTQMEKMVRQGMEEGAWGLSTGLWYAPMSFADQEEVVRICRVVAGYGGFYAIHMRDYGEGILSALEEALLIADQAGCPVQVSHLHPTGPQAKGRSQAILERIEQAWSQGIDVTCDTYPYLAGSTLLSALLPYWAQEGGPSALLARLDSPQSRQQIQEALASSRQDWSQVHIVGVHHPDYLPFEGLPLSEIARQKEISEPEVICDLLIKENLKVCFIRHQAFEEDLQAMLKHPAQRVGSDGLHLPGKTHPRLYGCFPRILARYWRDLSLLSLEEAIYKMTGATAERVGLRDRGRIAPGYAADLVVFDPQRVQDLATYDDPCRFPQGIEWVFVNGVPVVAQGEHTGATPGKVLKRGENLG